MGEGEPRRVRRAGPFPVRVRRPRGEPRHAGDARARLGGARSPVGGHADGHHPEGPAGQELRGGRRDPRSAPGHGQVARQQGAPAAGPGPQRAPGRPDMMTCERIEELLSAYVEGELAAAERAEVERHLAGCRECAELAALMREEMAAAAAFPEAEPSPGLMARLYAIPETKR